MKLQNKYFCQLKLSFVKKTSQRKMGEGAVYYGFLDGIRTEE